MTNLQALVDVATAPHRAGYVPITELGMTDQCGACLRIGGPSKEADANVMRSKAAGRPVYYGLHEIPDIQG